MRLAAVLLLIAAACTRPPAAQRAEQGVNLHNVKVTTWAGPELRARGTAERATLTPESFVAEDVALTTAEGTLLRAPRVEGNVELTRAAAPSGLDAKTAEGCEGSTRERVEWNDGVATTAGAITAKGCGVELSGSRLTYNLAEGRAEIFGPVRTRIEATP